MAVKSYRRFEAEQIVGLVSSPSCNVIYDSSGDICYTGMLEDVGRWNLKLSRKIGVLSLGEGQYPRKFLPVESTYIECSSNQIDLAVGYSDGSLCVYDLSSGLLRFTFNGHRAAISNLAYSSNANLLASASKDTSIVVWDLLSEVGLVRFKGHTNIVTGLCWLPNNTHIASSSTDSTIKVWNISTGQCVQTISNHLGVEIWSMTIGGHDDCYRIATGASDKKIRIFEVLLGDVVELKYIGCMNRNLTQDGRGKCIQVKFHPNSGSLLGVLGSGSVLELFRWRSMEESTKKRKRRIKRRTEKRKLKKKKEDGDASIDVPDDDAEEEEEFCSTSGSVATDEFEFISLARCSAKAKSFDFHPNLRLSEVDGSISTQVIVGLRNNALNVFSLDTSKRLDNNNDAVQTNGLLYGSECDLISTLSSDGHESDVRSVSLSSSNNLVVTCSQAAVKIWNASPPALISTIEMDGCLVCLFGPSDLHLVLGTKDGRLLLVDVSTMVIIKEISAHSNAIWTIDMRHDMTGIVTGSADHDVKLWDFVIANGNLSLENTKTVQLPDDVLCCRFSKVVQDSLRVKDILAVSTLDNAIKIFFSDSLKFKLSLYGHQLPVLSLDISDDGVMLVSGSADKTIKIWGLDFGDCRRSIHAHDDSIMSVKFLPRTHYLVSCSKDKSVKLWDCDEFELIMKLNGNLSPVWSVVVSSDGEAIISSGQDRSIRVWRKSNDLVFIQEERENEVEEEETKRWILSQSVGVRSKKQQEKDEDADAVDDPLTEFQSKYIDRILSEESKDIELTTLSSLQSMKSGERLMEALDTVAASDSDEPTPRTFNLKPNLFIHSILNNIKAADLEQAILMLRYHHAVQLIKIVCELVDGDDSAMVDLCCRVLAWILFLHQGPIQMNMELIPLLQRVRGLIHACLNKQRCMIGTNIASLKLMKMFKDENAQSETIV